MMTASGPSDRLNRLRELPIMRRLRPQDLKRLARDVCDASAPAGSVVLPAGCRVQHLYIVTVGTLATVTDDRSFELYGPGSVLLLKELLTGDLTTSALVALSDTELLTIGYRAFATACQITDGFAYAVLRAAMS